eukprot:Tbor_TRINITY_DN5176_c5_g5::TRINITY_DN5176_c5_g5_i1::g.25893::m.25893
MLRRITTNIVGKPAILPIIGNITNNNNINNNNIPNNNNNINITNTMTMSRRHMEPMSTWWLASWVMMCEYSIWFWFPLVIMDLIKPGFMYNKFPLLHFFEEKRSEAKLRRVLDSTCTQWEGGLDVAVVEDAISRGCY